MELEIDRYTTHGKIFLLRISCDQCVKLGKCTLRDSFRDLYDRWLESDVVLLAVSVYHMTIPGNIKNFIDRLGNCLASYYDGKIPKHLKVYGGLVQGINIFSGQEHTLTDIINHAIITGNVYTSGDLWENYIGAAGWTENDPETH